MSQASVTPWGSNFGETNPFSNNTVNILLAANTAISWTVPGLATQQYRAHFSASTSADVWVSYNATAAIPTSNVVKTNNQERVDVNFNRYVNGGDVLSFISTGTPQIGVSLLNVQN